jgi:regulator of sirC expression with transglutaminase-like and TPR domain
MQPIQKSSLLPAETRKAALLTLLADEDVVVSQAARQALLAYGPAVVDWLKPHALSNEPVLRKRTREVIDHFERHNADTEFLSFCLSQGEDFDLEQAALLLARTEYPSLCSAAFPALLDQYAAEIRERLSANHSPEQIIAVINEYLFKEMGFTGNEKNYYEPENSYFNRVMERKTGNPISLSMVYLFLGRRLRLPMVGIGLPGHFICRFQSSTQEFYIDAFNSGKILTKADCIKYLAHTNHSVQEGYLLPLSPRRMLLRVCANLHQIYTQRAQREEVSRLQRYLVALAK